MAPVQYSAPQEQTYNKGPSYLATVATLVSIALLTFLLRVYTRIKLLRIFAIDDGLMLVAALCSFGNLIAFALLVRLGLGHHRDELPKADVSAVGVYLWSFTVLIVIGISLVKLSVAFFLLRIIQRPQYRLVLYCMIAILVPSTLVWTFTLLFQCTPVAAAWNPELRSNAQCMSRTTYRNLNVFNSSINAATDLSLAILPLSIVWGLRVSLHAKLSLAAVLGLGFFSSAAAIVRMPLIYNMWSQHDPFAHSGTFCIWSVIEMTTGMTAACLPTLKPLFSTLSTFFSDVKAFRRTSST
ncbi:hypothetical protein P280DRAFT_399457, partial [Massarina eburnea CBS 473.64]